jgi:hypothetical protein
VIPSAAGPLPARIAISSVHRHGAAEVASPQQVPPAWRRSRSR